jgi:hypothetical protein
MINRGSSLADTLGNFLVYLREHPAMTQGGYYIMRGMIWMVVGIFLWGSVEPKRAWHTQEAGLMHLVVGATLIVASVRRQVSTEVRTLALSSAIALFLLETALVVWRDISMLYLFDVAIQVGILTLWMAHRRQEQRKDVPLPAAPMTTPPPPNVPVPAAAPAPAGPAPPAPVV